MKFDFDPGVVAGKFDDRKTIGFCKTVFEFDAGGEFFEFRRSVFEFAANFSVINARDFCGWMREAISEFAVICKEEKAFGVPVKSSDGEDAWHGFGEQVDDGCALFRVIKCCDAFRGLVEEDIITFFGIENGFVVDFDAAFTRDDVNAHFSDDAAADFDSALFDHFFGMSAAGNAGETQEFLKTNTGLWLSIFFIV